MNQVRSAEEIPVVTSGYTNDQETFSPASPRSSSYDSSSSDDSSDTGQEGRPVDLERISNPDSEVDHVESTELIENLPVRVTLPPEQQLHSNGLEAPEGGNLCSGIDAPERVYSLSNGGSQFSASLETADLWKQFDDVGTEMIVTRRGRRMFPPLKVQLFDLDPKARYVLLMDMSPCDKYRYKYQNSAWQKCFEEECFPTRLYIHPDSPSLGSHWMKSTISFYKLKLTNNQLDKLGHIIVNSMHKYQPRLHIVETTDVNNLKWEDFSTIIFPRTQFMTVTAYQNDRITQLKIDNNPFAKGFRLPFSRVRQRSRFPAPHQRYIVSSGSDSSIDENNVLVQFPGGTVIHTGPSFIPTMPTKDQGSRKRRYSGDNEQTKVNKHICLISTSREGDQPTLPHIVSPKLAYPAISGHPVSVGVSSVPESSCGSPLACHSPSFTERQENEATDGKKCERNSEEGMNGLVNDYNHKETAQRSLIRTSNGHLLRNNVRPTMVQADPSAGQSVHLPIILQQNIQPHPVMSSLQCSSPVKIIPVNGLNGMNGATSILPQPHALINGQGFFPKSPSALLNGVNYTMVVQASGQPTSFPTMPSTASSAAYTSAPTQLVNTNPAVMSHMRRTGSSIPMKTETRTVSTNHSPQVKHNILSAPPPLVPINTMSHPVTTPHNFSLVLQSSPPESPAHEKVHVSEAACIKSQNGIVYLQAPPTSYQKLVILPVMMNSIAGQQDSSNAMLVPEGANDTTVSSSVSTVVNGNLASSLIPDGYEEQMPSSMPIYRFSQALNGIQPVHFIPTNVPIRSTTKNIKTT